MPRQQQRAAASHQRHTQPASGLRPRFRRGPPGPPLPHRVARAPGRPPTAGGRRVSPCRRWGGVASLPATRCAQPYRCLRARGAAAEGSARSLAPPAQLCSLCARGGTAHGHSRQRRLGRAASCSSRAAAPAATTGADGRGWAAPSAAAPRRARAARARGAAGPTRGGRRGGGLRCRVGADRVLVGSGVCASAAPIGFTLNWPCCTGYTSEGELLDCLHSS